MPTFQPQDAALREHIEHYWIVDADEALAHLSAPLHEFTSLAPELVLGIEGRLGYVQRGHAQVVREATFFGHIDQGLTVHPEALRQMVVVRFKPHGVSSMLPFVPHRAVELVRCGIGPAREVFGASITALDRHIRLLPPRTVADELDTYFQRRLDLQQTGLVREVMPRITPTTTVRDLAALTRASYSTVERHFKRELGLTPKRFLMRNRFKHVLADLFRSHHTDWFEYIVRYGYHDQMHFIKEIKRFSGFTPRQLLTLPYFTHYRP
ncbi:MAG: helix-turn-helix domain-containing protein [Rhodothermales bacterium]